MRSQPYPISKIFLSLTVALIGVIAAPSAYAQTMPQITIQDTGGFTRAASDVEQSGNVEFSVIGENGAAANNVQIQLSNSTTGQTLTTVSTNGSAVFEGVTPGVWVVSTTTPGVTFTGVTVASIAASSAIGAGVGLGTAALIVGGTAGGAIAISEINDNSSDGDPVSPFR